MTVADVTGDVEGEDDGGSVDVEERNHLARAATTSSADVVVVVGAPGLKGVHALGDCSASSSPPVWTASRVIPVINQAPRHPRAAPRWRPPSL